MSDMFGSMQQVVLQRLKVGARQMLSTEMPALASSVHLDAQIDYMTQRMILDLRAHVLAEQLPPQTIRHRIRVQTDDPRHATWFDAFKDTYRQRWWMRWRRWTVRYVKTPVTVERTVEVSVRDNWTYPRAATVLPESQWGHPVLVATWTASDFWTNWK